MKMLVAGLFIVVCWMVLAVGIVAFVKSLVAAGVV